MYIQKQELKSGIRWKATIDLPADPVTGKRRQKRFTGKTKREVERLAREALHAIEHGGLAEPGRLTVAEYLRSWLESKRRTIRANTYRRYVGIVNNHIIPQLGNRRLAKLSSTEIDSFYTARLEDGLSPASVAMIHAVLTKALKDAVRSRPPLLMANPCDGVQPPRATPPELKVWDAEQVAKFLKVADESNLAALWRVAVLVGLRKGELLALPWDAVDLERGALSVRQTLIYSKGAQWELGEPKTKKGRRRISLPASVTESLKQHRKRQNEYRLSIGPAWEDHGFVFTNATGGPLPTTSLAREFNRLIAEAGLPTIRVHDLRHSCASLMLAIGEHPKIVQERLGHSDISMTLDRYSHVTGDMQAEASSRLDSLISGI